MKKETKRQHYVPLTYLKRFAIKRNQKFFINAAEKNNLEKIIFPNITNVCVENGFYTLSGDNEAERQAAEAFYSDNIETQYDKVYSVLTDVSVHEISYEMHYQIILTVITMLYRTSKWVHMINDHFDEALKKVFALSIQHRKNSFMIGEKEYSIAGGTLEEVQEIFRKQNKDSQVLIQLEVAMKLINIRQSDGIMVSKLSDEYHLFTSDNPVLLENIKPGRIVPFDPENMIRLPLDTRHILTIMPHSQSDGSHLILRLKHDRSMSMAKMIANNSYQLFSCYKYILGTKKGLNDYISKRKEFEKPINSEQRKKLDEINEMIQKTGLFNNSASPI